MVEAMTTEDEKVLERRLRRMAERQELRLRKSRTRDPYAKDYGMYYVINWSSLGHQIEGAAWSVEYESDSLADVERWLKREGRDRKATS
jgi:hypothetical protein